MLVACLWAHIQNDLPVVSFLQLWGLGWGGVGFTDIKESNYSKRTGTRTTWSALFAALKVTGTSLAGYLCWAISDAAKRKRANYQQSHWNISQRPARDLKEPGMVGPAAKCLADWRMGGMRAPSLKTMPFSSGEKIITNKANPLGVHGRRRRLPACWEVEGRTTFARVYLGRQCNSKGFLKSLVLSYSLQGNLLHSGVRAKYTVSVFCLTLIRFKGASLTYAGSLGQRNTLEITRGLLTRNFLL